MALAARSRRGNTRSVQCSSTLWVLSRSGLDHFLAYNIFGIGSFRLCGSLVYNFHACFSTQTVGIGCTFSRMKYRFCAVQQYIMGPVTIRLGTFSGFTTISELVNNLTTSKIKFIFHAQLKNAALQLRMLAFASKASCKTSTVF